MSFFRNTQPRAFELRKSTDAISVLPCFLKVWHILLAGEALSHQLTRFCLLLIRSMKSSDEERKVSNVSCLRLAVHDIYQFFSGKNKKIILVGLFYYQRLSVFAFSCCSSCGSNDGGGGDSSDGGGGDSSDGGGGDSSDGGGGDSSDGGGVDSSDGSTALTRQMRSFQLWVLWRTVRLLPQWPLY